MKDWYWSWNFNTLATWCKEQAHWKRPWCWERLKAGEEGDNRGPAGWMASPTQQTWVWANSGRWWRTGKPGVQQPTGSQRVRHDWSTEQQFTCLFSHLTISSWQVGSTSCSLLYHWMREETYWSENNAVNRHHVCSILSCSIRLREQSLGNATTSVKQGWPDVSLLLHL